MSVVRRLAPPGTWEEDAAASTCFLCSRSFGAINRRHHCRECGRVVCGKCSDNTVAMTNEHGMIEQNQRCCDTCYRAGFAPRTPSTAAPPPAREQPAAGDAARQDEEEASEVRSSASAAAAEAAAARAVEEAQARATVAEDETTARGTVTMDEVNARSVVVMARSADAARIAHTLARKRQISKPSLEAAKQGKWVKAATADGVEVRSSLLPGAQKKAIFCAITIPGGELLCAINVLQDDDFMHKLEPTLISVETQQDPQDEGVWLSLTKYKSSGIISARDFATVSAEHMLAAEDVAGIVPSADSDVFKASYIRASVDHQGAAQSAGFVRGAVNCHAYIACESETGRGDATTLRLVHVSHTDPRGSIPAFALETTFGDIAKRIAKIRDEVIRRSEEARKERMSTSALGDDVVIEKDEPAIRSSMATKSREGDEAAAASGNGDEAPAAASEARHVDPQPDADETTAKPAAAEEQVAAEAEEVAAEPEAEEEEEEVEEKPPTPPPVALTERKRRVIMPALNLHLKAQWRLSKTLENCDLEDTPVPFCDKKALRIKTTMRCSLATLAEFLNDASQLRKYDPTLDVFEVLKSAPENDETTTVYSSYKRQTRLIDPRDFCVEACSANLLEDEVRKEGIARGGVAFISGSINSKQKPPVKTHTRGVLHLFGYIATAPTFDSTPVTVYNVMCADPCGKIPNWIIEAAQAESCKKLAKIRNLVEECHRLSPAKFAAPAPKPPKPEEPKPVVVPKPVQPKPVEEPAAKPAAASADAEGDGDDATDGDFHSCIDEEEFQHEREEMRNFHTEEVDRICAHLTKIHVGSEWSAAKMVEGCKVQSAPVPGVSVKAQRISTEFFCSVETFKSVISNTRSTYLIDPTVETVEMLQSPPYGAVIYTSYKSGSRLLSDRDFCSLTTSKLLSMEEGADLQLYTRGIHSSAFVVSSVNSTDMPERKGYVRGDVVAYGFIVVATPPNARRIRVFHIACVDPKGNIPAKVVDAAVAEVCKKINRLKELCANAEADNSETGTVADAASAAAANDASGSPVRDSSPMSPAGPTHPPFQTVERPFLALQTSRGWGGAHQVGSCRVDTQDVPDTDICAYRVCAEFKCSIATFAAVLNTTSTATEIDPTLEVIRVTESRQYPGASCLYTAYKSGSRLVSSRDFCMASTSRVLPLSEGSELGLYTSGIASRAFLSCSVDSSDVRNQEGYVRGSVHAAGYLAMATPPTARRIRVFHVIAIRPGGNVPSKLVKAAIQETCAKVVKLRVICEEREAEAAHTMQEVPEPEVTPSVAASPESAAVEPEGGVASTTVRDASPDAAEPEAAAADATSGKVPEASPEPAAPVGESTTNDSDRLVAPSESAPRPVREMTPGMKAILKPMLDLQLRCTTWKRLKVMHECILEDTAVSYSDKHAQRVTTTMQCSLKTFAAFLSDVRMLKRYDPTLSRIESLLSPADGDVVYTSYKQATRLIAPRDFCTITTKAILRPEEAEANGISTDGKFAVIHSGIDHTAMPHQKGFVRGRVHVYGFFATAESFASVPITVHNISCVDPSGSIPSWVVEVAVTENVKKLAKIRDLARSYHVAMLNKRASQKSATPES